VQSQTKLLVKIVDSDPFFSGLTVLNDRMNDVLQFIAKVQDHTLHTERRVDNVESRVEQLELRPTSHESGICFCIIYAY